MARGIYATPWTPSGGERVRGCEEDREFRLGDVRFRVCIRGGYGLGQGGGSWFASIERLGAGSWENVEGWRRGGWSCPNKTEAKSTAQGLVRSFLDAVYRLAE